MFGWFRALMPREDAFFDMFERQAAFVASAAGSLRAVVAGDAEMSTHVGHVIAREAEADEVYAQVMNGVRRSFITPFDRTAIIALATSLDDVVDEMKKCCNTVTVFSIGAFEPEMVEMVDVIVTASSAVSSLVPLLRDVAGNATLIAKTTQSIGDLESITDDLRDAARTRLHAKAKDDPAAFHAVDFQVACELLAQLEHVGDRLEDVAKRVAGIAIENA